MGALPLTSTTDIRELEKNKKSEIWLAASELIQKTDISIELIRELKRLMKGLELACFRILKDLPCDGEGKPTLLGLEGRGMYLNPVDFNQENMDERLAIYVKGSGSPNCLQKHKKGQYRAFGRLDTGLFADDTKKNHHPRIWGTETLRWGGLEIINAVTVLASYIHLYKLKSVCEILDLGISIPIGMSRFEELSNRLVSFIKEEKQKNEKIAPNFHKPWKGDWKGNIEGHGAVALLVPGTRRVLGKNNERINNPQELIFGSLYNGPEFHGHNNPRRYELIGRTVRTLLQLGFMMSNTSQHKQNIYDADWSACPIADHSDFVPIFYLTKSQIQGMLIYLVRYSDFSPRSWPDEDSSVDEHYEQCRGFFTGLLNNANTAATVANLFPYIADDISQAVIKYLMEFINTKAIQKVAKIHKKLLSTADPSIAEQFHDKIKENIKTESKRKSAIHLTKTGRAIYNFLHGNPLEETPAISTARTMLGISSHKQYRHALAHFADMRCIMTNRLYNKTLQVIQAYAVIEDQNRITSFVEALHSLSNVSMDADKQQYVILKAAFNQNVDTATLFVNFWIYVMRIMPKGYKTKQSALLLVEHITNSDRNSLAILYNTVNSINVSIDKELCIHELQNISKILEWENAAITCEMTERYPLLFLGLYNILKVHYLKKGKKEKSVFYTRIIQNMCISLGLQECVKL
jgi:hypothetical protein